MNPWVAFFLGGVVFSLVIAAAQAVPPWLAWRRRRRAQLDREAYACECPQVETRLEGSYTCVTFDGLDYLGVRASIDAEVDRAWREIEAQRDDLLLERMRLGEPERPHVVQLYDGTFATWPGGEPLELTNHYRFPWRYTDGRPYPMVDHAPWDDFAEEFEAGSVTYGTGAEP